MLPNPFGGALGAAALACLTVPAAVPAQAHVTFEVSQATVNAVYKATLRVPHGCGSQATRAVRVPDADRLRVLFVSVDPARDTSDLLRTYLASFDPRITGLTGTEGEIAAAAKAYRAFYRKVTTESGQYTMEHTATVYLMDGRGRFFSALDYHEGREAKLAKIRRLLREG